MINKKSNASTPLEKAINAVAALKRCLLKRSA